MKGRITSVIAIALVLALFVPYFSFAQKPVSFTYHQSLIFVRVKVNEKKDLLFLMDTGANISSIDNKTCGLLKLPVLRTGDSVTGTAGKEGVNVCNAKTLQLGGISIKNAKLVSRDLSRFITPSHEKLAGILGTDFLKQYAITIDYSKKTLLLSKKKAVIKREKVVAFDMIGGIPRFEARINDTLTTYVNYNSGVSLQYSNDVFVNVSHKQWSILKGLDKYLVPYTNMAGDGVGGRVQLPVVKIKRIMFNGLEVIKPNIVIQPREGYFLSDNAIGFFGNNLLEKYRKVTIDFLSNKVILHSINKSVAMHTIKKR
jgi:hypothetical protein